MRDFSIDIIWAKVQMAITALGGLFGYFVGGVDGLLRALLFANFGVCSNKLSPPAC